MSVEKEIKDKVLFRLLNDVSLRTNIPIDTVKNIVFSQFKFLKIMMAVGDREDENSFLTISLVNIGKFSPKKSYIKFCREKGITARRKQKDEEFKKRRDERKG